MFVFFLKFVNISDMNKKILIMSSVAVILIAGAGYWVYKDFFALKAENIGAEDTGKTIGGVNYEIVEVKPDETISAEADDQFKKTALEITNMPVVFSSEVSEASKEKIKTAIEELNKQIGEEYSHLDLLLELGIKRQSVGDYVGAAKTWEFAGLVFPKNYITFQNLGFVYGFYLKDYVLSEKNYLKSLENDPTNTQVYLDLVDIYNFSGQAEKIPEFLKSGFKNAGDANEAQLKALLAKYYADNKDNANAVKYYEEVLVVDPSNTTIKQEIERLRAL